MLNAEVRLLSVDWKVVLDALLPAVIRRTRQIEHPSFLIRLVNKLGDSSSDALAAVLAALSAETRGELICALLNQYQDQITQMLNEILMNDQEKYPIRLNGFHAHQEADGILSIDLTNIIADYSILLSNNYAQIAVKIFRGQIDKMAAWVIQKKPKLLTDRVQAVLEERGLTGIQMDIALTEGMPKQTAAFQIGEAAQEEILDVLVGFISRIARIDDPG